MSTMTTTLPRQSSTPFNAAASSLALLRALRSRNARDAAFSEIVQDYSVVSTMALEAQTRTAQLEKEAHELRAESSEASGLIGALRAEAARGARAAEAETELLEARKEASAAYKEKSRIAEEALEASRALVAAREANEAQAKALEMAAKEVEDLRKRSAELTEAADAANKAAAASEEELRERLRAKEEALARAVASEAEVAELSRRLVELKSCEIERMNAVNEQCDDMLRAARSAARGAAALAAARGAATAAAVGGAASGLLDRAFFGRRSVSSGTEAAAVATRKAAGLRADGVGGKIDPSNDDDDEDVGDLLPPAPPPSLLPDTLGACLPPHAGGAYAAAFDRSGRALATAGADRVVRLWEPSSLAAGGVEGGRSGSRGGVAGDNSTSASSSSSIGCVGSLHGMLDTVTCLAFTCDGSGLIAGGEDRALRLWEVNVGGNISSSSSMLGSGRVRHTLTGHAAKVTCCSASPADSSFALSAGSDRAIKLWDLRRGFCSQSLVCGSACHSAAFSADGVLVFTGHFDGGLRAWDTKSGKCVSEVKNLHSAQVTSVSVSVDGATLLTCGRDSCLRVSDARSLKPKTPTKAGSSPSSSSSSANSSPCPPMTDPAFAVTSVWCSAALGPDAKHAAAASGDGSGLFVWETDTGKRVRRLTTTTMSSSAVGALAVSWSPQGSPLVCCDRGGGVSLWVPREEAR